MRSLAERTRVIAEGLLRVAAIALLAATLAWAIRTRTHGSNEQAESNELADALVRWSTTRSPARVHVQLDHAPAGEQRDWLAALNAAGTDVQWSGPQLLPAAVAIEPRVDPAGGADVAVAAPQGVSVLLRDTAGMLDSTRADAFGVRAFIARPRPVIEAQAGQVTARAAIQDSVVIKRLLVIGAAGWETKFAIAALEERGWQVDAHIMVSPQTIARQGRVEAIDTSRYAAVLAIDSTAVPFAGAITRFVRSGGGLVLWSPAARAFPALAPGRAGALIRNENAFPKDSVPRGALDLVPVVSLASDAIALERRGDDVAIAARRVGAGRVIQTGYTDSWRWRMHGGDHGPDAHRTWLTGLAGNVAYAPRVARTTPPTDPVPVAALVHKLGPASPAAFRASWFDDTRLHTWIFLTIMTALLAEWASRRLRGVR